MKQTIVIEMKSLRSMGIVNWMETVKKIMQKGYIRKYLQKLQNKYFKLLGLEERKGK